MQVQNLLRKVAVPVGAALGSVSAFATDPADTAVAAIAAAQTSSLLIVGSLMALGVAIFGGMLLYRKFFK